MLTNSATPNHCHGSQGLLTDASLDDLLDSSTNIDQPLSQTSPIVLRRTTRQSSGSHSINFKRLADNDDQIQNSRKYPKLLTQALKDEFKVECQDISPSTAIAATKLLTQVSSLKINSCEAQISL